MSLPKQTLPIYSLKIPSSGKTVRFRQFTVREEKAMIQAKESEDMDVILNAVKEVITTCVPEITNIDELALFDIEYIITKIRAKSVGESIELNMLCDIDDSHARIPYAIDLEKLEVTFDPSHSKDIKLYEDVGVVMRYPSHKDIKFFETLTGVELIALFIDYVYNTEEIFYAKDQSKQELLDFLHGLTLKQIQNIENKFFKTMPVYKYDMKYTCKECGHEHYKVIKGLASFFA